MVTPNPPRKTWDMFYKSETPDEIQSIENTKQQTPDQNSIFIARSYFTGKITSQQFGFVYVNNSNADVLVETSSFIEITSSNWAVALYFKVKNAVYYKICGFDAKTTSTGTEIFDHTEVGDNINNKNIVLLSSFGYIKSPSGSKATSHHYGQELVKYANTSHNECAGCSAIQSVASKENKRISALFSYSSFVNNSATSNDYCIYIRPSYEESKYLIQSCNIISNKQNTNTYGLVSSSCELTIDNSCIMNNNATLVVAVYNNYKMTLINTFIDEDSSVSGDIINNFNATSYING